MIKKYRKLQLDVDMEHKSDKVATARCSEKMHNWLLGVGPELQSKGTWIERNWYSTRNKHLMFPLVLMAQLNNEKLSQGFSSLQNFGLWARVRKALVAQSLLLNLINNLLPWQISAWYLQVAVQLKSISRQCVDAGLIRLRKWICTSIEMAQSVKNLRIWWFPISPQGGLWNREC